MAPKRLLWRLLAAAPGAEARFAHQVTDAVNSKPAENRIAYYVPFVFAERVLGDAAIIDADPRHIDALVFSQARSDDGLETPRDHFLIDGKWQPLIRDLEKSKLDGEVRELIACEGDYRATEAYQRLRRRLRQDGRFTHNGVSLRTDDDLKAYFEHHLRLIASIRRHGVLRRSQLKEAGGWAGRFTPNAGFLESVETDAGVAVGPEGQLLRYRGGFHRTAAARELGLPSMPVQVKLVHLQWLRDRIARTGLAPRAALSEGLRQLSVSSPPHDRTPKPR